MRLIVPAVSCPKIRGGGTVPYLIFLISVGHTPQAGGQIGQRFDGKVYLIDTGMLSSYFPGGRASALNIQNGKVSFIY